MVTKLNSDSALEVGAQSGYYVMISAGDLPQAFREQMRSLLGSSYPAFEKSLGMESLTTIRTNPRKPASLEYSATIPWCKEGKVLPARPVFTLDPLFHAGAYYPQEASSMFLEQALSHSVDLTQPLRVLDLCAAPGGKSTHLLSLLSPTSLLVSNEVIRPRASILAENIQKWGYAHAVVTNNDPQHFRKLTTWFDVIVVDAPCSGEGMFRKDPQAASEWSPGHVALCAQRQQRILAEVWPALRKNGILIYSTCTYNKTENEENLQWLRSLHAVEFLQIKTDPAWGIIPVDEQGVYGYRFYPHAVPGEGFFLTVVRKPDGPDATTERSGRSSFASLPKALRYVEDWSTSPHAVPVYRDGAIQLLPTSHLAAIDYLSHQLRIVQAGTAIGEVKHDKVIPAHALALSADLNPSRFPAVDFTLEDALRFLRKETMSIQTDFSGFSLARYNNQPLGWMNVLQNRINNMYPSAWRIRM
jgi:16S rRNA C967 or C1407 C5-methylase (RsmB/RsmF family)/NOL1/NOP2/fmu family ribosome biogenesis protein